MGPLIRIRGEVGEEALDIEEFEARVRRGEIAGHCPVHFPPLTGEAWVRADSLELFRRLHQPGALYFSRAFNLGRFPRMTAVFILADVALFLLMRREGPIDQDALVAWGAKVAPLMLDLGQLWRLVTANLLHENGLHIAFNLFVLFNVGGALENAYRRLDYLLLLAASALGTTLVSLWALPEAITAGASGIVYGALGAAVVFGIRYRDLLPPRYRRVLGQAIIPTVLVFLYIGFTSSNVDNWAHLGGLAAGALTATALRPRLLVEAPATARSLALRLAPFAAAGVAIAAAGALLEAGPVHSQPTRDDAFGIEARVPATWWRGTDRFGAIAFHNGLPGLGRASFTAQAQLAPHATPERALEDYVLRNLIAEERAGLIADLSVQPSLASSIGGLEGRVLYATYSDEGFGTNLRAWFVTRGELVYELVFQWPVDYPAYERVIEQVASSIRLFEPRALREARARALLDPAPAPLAALADTLDRLGDLPAAGEALGYAVDLDDDADLRAHLARIRLELGATDEGCRQAELAQRQRPQRPRVLEVVADCLLARGKEAEAARLLRKALELAPSDDRIAARLRGLIGGGKEK